MQTIFCRIKIVIMPCRSNLVMSMGVGGYFFIYKWSNLEMFDRYNREDICSGPEVIDHSISSKLL